MSRKFISIISILLLIVLSSLLFLFLKTQERIYQAEDESIQLVAYDYSVERVNKFYWTTTDQSYFSLDFQDENNEQRYAIISQVGGDIAYFTPQDIISEEDAMAITLNDMSPHRILQMRLAMLNEVPIWEATIQNEDGTITYYTLNAQNGSWIQTVENI